MSFRNEGNIDRGIRVVLGVLLLVAGWGGIVEGVAALHHRAAAAR